KTDPKGIQVRGVDGLLTRLAKCCAPVVGEPIIGYVTRGKGVAIHRSNCSNFRQMLRANPERAIAVAWGAKPTGREALYPVKVWVEASERTGLLRDISELFAKERMNVTAVHTQPAPNASGAVVHMELTVEVDNATRLPAALAQITRIPGVRSARRH
ncbi:MAG TPA: ACT domain-containing protein, partial [Burkholderiaceae bacterium]